MSGPILKAISQGFTSKQIIDFILRKFPQHSDKIKNALAMGFGADRILQYLTGGRNELNKNTLGTEHERTRTSEREKEAGQIKGALGTAAAIAAPFAARLGAPLAQAALQHAAPQLMGPGAATNIGLGQTNQPATIQSPQGQPPSIPTGTLSQQPPVNAPTIPQQALQTPSEEKTIDPEAFLSKHGLLEQVKKLSIQKKDPKLITAMLYSKFPKEMQAFQKEAGKNMEDAIADYLQKTTPENVPKPTELVEMPKKVGDKFIDRKGEEATLTQINDKTFEFKTASRTRSGALSSLRDEISQEKPLTEKATIAKNETVASPQGIGEVKEIRNGKAIIEVDGKLHKVDENELESEPEEVKQSRIEVDLNKVPENLRSAPLNEVYVPAHRRHLTIKYNSDVGKEKSKRYIFYKKDGSPIDESIIEKLRIGSQIPVTSGKNFWGGWDANTQDSRGTVAYHELSDLSQEEGEEDDPSKPYWFELEEEVFTHGFSKAAEKALLQKKKEFDEEEKRKKKRARKRR